MAKKHQKNTSVRYDEAEERKQHASEHGRDRNQEQSANPPRTTTGPLTAPKFGAAGSGGAELEPGPKKN